MSFDLQTVTFFEEIRSILQHARQNAYAAVNSAMVEAYWQIGRRIVEEEQKGQERADYGKRLLQELARQLTGEFGKGFSVTNLKLMRQFYLGQKGLIGQTLSDQFSPNSPTKKQRARTFPLSWSHYVLLLGIRIWDRCRCMSTTSIGTSRPTMSYRQSASCSVNVRTTP